MAGFVNRRYNEQTISKSNFVTRTLKDLSRLGMRFDDQIVKNSRSVGIKEKGQLQNTSQSDEDIWNAFASLTMSDTSLKDNVAFFDKGYEQKREELRKVALNDEIEDIVEILTDECIIYDENQMACRFYYNGNIKDELKDEINSLFKKIYFYFGFSDGYTLWDYFKKWLVDGFLCFEIIYDKTMTKIIGFKEIDPITVKPSISIDDSGNTQKVYIQYQGQANKERVLYDSQIVYISFSQNLTKSRISYVERLIRSFNLLRIMETTRISWAVTNASYKLKFIMPMSGKSKNRAKQSLAQVMNNYREDITFNIESGELKINGQPMTQFNREYWLPMNESGTPEIESLGGEGPEISDTEALKYFVNKMRDASKIPYNRFDAESPTGYELAAEGLMRDEIRFGNFIKRLHARFKAIMLKPLYIQTVLLHPELKNDESFRINLSVIFNKNNVFDEMKEYELMQKRIDIITSLKDSLVTQDAEMNDIQYFDINFLVEKILVDKYLKLTMDDMELNSQYKQVTKIEKEGYKRSDAQRIYDGEKRSKFKMITEPAPATPDIADAELEAMPEE